MKNYKHIEFDLSNCDKEPIHIIGRIQPRGFLAILNSTSLAVEQVSENVGYYLDTDPESLLGSTLKLLCSDAEYALLENQLRNYAQQNPQLLTIQGQMFFGFLYESSGKLILECEPFVSSSDQDRLEYSYRFSNFQSELNSLDSLEEQANKLVDLIQSFLGYDRVMLYAFDQDWNGEVIAEKTNPGVHSYLHHHFPASDIPAPARALLQKKFVRQIADVHAAAVDIVPYLNPETGSPSNIIESELRNPSEIHLEYLRNMGVQASLSISVIVRGKLWGVVTCHHETPIFIEYWRRQVCHHIAKAFSNALVISKEKRDRHTLDHYIKVEETLVEQVNQSDSIEEGLFRKDVTLLDITEAGSAVLALQNRIIATPGAPDEQAVLEVIEWLSKNNTQRLFYTDELTKHLPGAIAYKEAASGLLALEISRYNKEYILYFKPEIRETRIWAGNPEKPAVPGEGMHIHPRESFSAWKEEVEGNSQPWKPNELEVAQLLLKDVTAILLRNQAATLNSLNQELQATAEELSIKNQRLEDFTHIMAHNLRSPMSNIRGLYALYQAEPDYATAVEVMEKMQVMIRNMAATIDDLNLLVRASLDQQLPLDKVNLDEIIQKELQNLGAIIQETNADVEVRLEVPEITIPKIYMESILHNLLSNALKYRSPNRRPVLKVASRQEKGYTCLTVSDNGLGMDLLKAGPKLFGLYKTFHKNKDAKGLGLYLTKLQVESLGGTIELQSEPDKGTTFNVKLPSNNK